MKTKFFTLLSLSVLVLVMVMSFASATVTVSNLNTLDQFGNTQTFTISNYDNSSEVNVSLESQTITDPDGNTATIDFNSTDVIVPVDGSVTVEAHVSAVQENFFYGTQTQNYLIQEDEVPENNATLTIKFENTPLDSSVIDDVNNKDLRLKIKDVNVISGFGKDTDWFPLDEVEVEVEVKNDNNNEKMKNIVVSWGLYNTETGEWYVDDEENDFRLKSNNKKTLTFSFKLDDNIDEFADGDDYILYVWANAVLDTESGETNIGASTSEKPTIEIENDFVILYNLQDSETASCGTDLQITADVWNIGEDDQTDVYVFLSNQELGISKKIMIGDIDAFDNEKIDTMIKIPQDAEEKTYLLTAQVYDEYDEIFQNTNDDKAESTIHLKVEGNCINEPKAKVSASLESEATAGKELIVKVTLTNTGVKTSTFKISLSDYINWATLGSIVPEEISLDSGESKDVLITLNVNSDVSGSQNFEVITTEGTKVLSQPVAVMIEKPVGLAGITGNLISEANWPIWTIGAINIILVFIIILVALKVAKKQ